VNRDVAWRVRQRAQDRCEYCYLPASVYPLPFHIDHIIPRLHGGKSAFANFALVCLHCNRHKGPTGPPIRLFHPRADAWEEHFEWQGAMLAGRTPVGKVTIQVLAINKPDFLALRKALLEERVFPLV
jgi:hypothetical protein